MDLSDFAYLEQQNTNARVFTEIKTFCQDILGAQIALKKIQNQSTGVVRRVLKIMDTKPGVN